jgi:hypothetical protein
VSTHQRKFILWIASVGLVIALATGGILWLISRVPSLNDQIPPNQNPTIVLITSPERGSSWPADAFIPVRVSVESEAAITQLELWVDGELHRSLDLGSSQRSTLLETINWLPIATGKHRLVAYVQDVSGQRSVSNIVDVTASEPAGFGVVEAGASPAESLEPRSILPPGSSDQYPPSSLPSPASAPLAISYQPPSSFSVWLADLFNADVPLPEAPELSYALDGCTVNLLVKDQTESELGYFIYRSSPGSSAFERIDVIGKIDQGNTAQHSDPDQKGPLDYYVAAFNQAGESPSNPVHIKSTAPGCQADGMQDTRADGFDFTLPPDVTLAYVYYAYNGGGYSRYPSNPDSFLTPIKHAVSLDTLIDSIVSWAPYPVSTVDLVLWGWEGGSLVNLGAFHTLVDRSDLTFCNLGTNCTGDVAGNFKTTLGTVASNAEDQVHEFYWISTARGTTEILWQIATQPFLAGFQSHPAGLVAAGCQKGSKNGSFLVDFADLNAYLPGPAGCGMASSEWSLMPDFSIENILFQPENTTYYARFTPMMGNQPAGDPSNTVIINYGPGEDLIEPVIEEHLPLIYQVEIVDFQPIKLADMTYWGCVSIVSLDYQRIWNSFRDSYPSVITDKFIDALAGDLYDELKKVQDNNMIVCPTAYEGGDDYSVIEEWSSSLKEGLTAFWEAVQSAIEGIKSTAVDLAAGALNTIGIPCDDTCKAGLKFGIETGLTYFTGVPPTLPDFDQLVDEGINYAIQLAAAEAGIPCPEACQDALRSGLEEVADLVKQTSSQPACVDADWANLLGKNAFCLPDGVETDPVPEGLHEPAGVVVKITRPSSTSGIPTPDYDYFDMPSYVLRVRVFESNPEAAGRTYTYDYYYSAPGWDGLDFDDLLGGTVVAEQNDVVEADPTNYQTDSKYFTLTVTPAEVAGQTFLPQSIPVPPLAPGEEFTIPMSLGQDSYYFDEHVAALFNALSARNLTLDEVGSRDGFMGLGGSQGKYFDWNCLYNGGTVKVEAEIYCLSVPTGLSGTTGPTENSYLVPCGAKAEPFFRQIETPLCQPK